MSQYFFFSSRRRHTRCGRDWSSDVCSSDLVRPLPDDDRGALDGRGRRRVDAVEDERVGGLLDEVEDVVEPADERVDLLPVEWRDERRLEPVADVVADLVPAMLGVPDLNRPAPPLVVTPQHGFEQA